MQLKTIWQPNKLIQREPVNNCYDKGVSKGPLIREKSRYQLIQGSIPPLYREKSKGHLIQRKPMAHIYREKSKGRLLRRETIPHIYREKSNHTPIQRIQTIQQVFLTKN